LNTCPNISQTTQKHEQQNENNSQGSGRGPAMRRTTVSGEDMDETD